MTQTRDIRVGLVGCGRIAGVHLRHLRRAPYVRVAGVCDLDAERARAFAVQHGINDVLGSVAELLAVGVDAVHVLTPPTAHADVAVAALERGVHVLVEKPMATTSAAAQRMRAAARAAGRLLCVDHNRLFDPVIMQARDLIASGAIGALVSVEASQGVNVQEGGPAAAPLTMWLNLAPHPLYLLRDFIGEIAEWHVVGGPLGELRAVFKGSRALGYLCFSPAATPYLNGLVLHGTKATLQIDLNTMMLTRRHERRLPKMLAKAALNVDQGVQLLTGTARTTLKVASGRMGTYPGMGVVIQRFYEAIAGRGDLPVSGADGHAIVELLEKLWMRSHRKTVSAIRRRPRCVAPLPHERPILVTGAAGFLGRHVVAQLRAEGRRVRVLIHSTPHTFADDGVEVVAGSLGDDATVAEAVAGAEAVVHCGARVARGGSRADFFRDNVSGTAHLLEAARAAGVERFVHVSSIAVYDWQAGAAAIHEDAPYDPHPERRGAYTWSKLEADRLVQEFGRRGGLRTVVLRPGILVGRGGPTFTARLCLGRLAGRVVVVGRRAAQLPLCHVMDAARAASAAVGAPGVHGAYNLVDDSLTQDEWLRQRRASGWSGRPLYIPPWMASVPAAGVELLARVARRSPPLSRYKLKRATESLRYDTRRAREELGWTPLHTCADFRNPGDPPPGRPLAASVTSPAQTGVQLAPSGIDS